jgi:coenzyme F420-0:L-glutamate ligase/coenzyme F420-1:gamma-L-glutamate ligase
MNELRLFGVANYPEVTEGDRLADLIAERTTLEDGDVVVVTSKIVAKAEGRVVSVDRSDSVARTQLIDDHATRTLRKRGDLMITETVHGFVCANSGIDWSNVGAGSAVLLPRDPDRAAFKIRERLRAAQQVEVAVIVSDTFGRAWRNGVTDVALGSSGIKPILDLRGSLDHHGNEMTGTQICIVDEIASAAELVMGKARRVPVVVVRGIDPEWLDPTAGDVRGAVVRSASEDLFR